MIGPQAMGLGEKRGGDKAPFSSDAARMASSALTVAAAVGLGHLAEGVSVSCPHSAARPFHSPAAALEGKSLCQFT